MTLTGPRSSITAPVALLVAAFDRVTGPLLRALVGPAAVRGACVACGDPVRERDAFLRYRGEYYHAGPCLEDNPPALQQQRQPGSARARAGNRDPA